MTISRDERRSQAAAGCEKHSSVGDIVGLAHTPHPDHGLCVLEPNVGDPAGLYRPRGNGVGPHPSGSEIKSSGAGESFDGDLGCAVADLTGESAGGIGGDIDRTGRRSESNSARELSDEQGRGNAAACRLVGGAERHRAGCG